MNKGRTYTYNHNIHQNIIIKSMPKQFTSSTPPNPHQELELALQALFTSAKVIYSNFQFVFHILGLLLLAILAYNLGRFSVSESIAQKVKAIQKRIKDVEEEKQGLPVRVKNVTRFYFRLIIFFLFLAAGAGALIHTQYINIDIVYVAPFLVIPLCLYIFKIIHVSSLTAKSKKFPEKQKQIVHEVREINKELGPRVQASLKNMLCREKIQSRLEAPSHICNKKECQQIRQTLKAKYEVIKNLAQCALQFEWCSTCKSRKPFDELIKFEGKPMPAVRDGDASQEQDAEVKIGYLLETLEEVDKWIQEAGPCNCSKLYMEEIVKNKRNTNRLLKQINARIEAHERQRQANASVIRNESKMGSTENPYMQVRGGKVEVRNKNE